MTAALILIDFQNDYFPGGDWALEQVDAAASKAAQLLNAFRHSGQPVVHVRHEFETDMAPFFRPGSVGAHTHHSVAPSGNEPVVLKHKANGFHGTNLKQILDDAGVNKLVICGAMSHMCIDGTTRAARDLGYECVVVQDACATRAVEFEGIMVPAEQVHAAFMSALGFAYAQVLPVRQVLADMRV